MGLGTNEETPGGAPWRGLKSQQRDTPSLLRAAVARADMLDVSIIVNKFITCMKVTGNFLLQIRNNSYFYLFIACRNNCKNFITTINL